MSDLSAYLTPTTVLIARCVLWLLLGLAFAGWIKGALTPARFLTIFESEGVLSIRQILAAVVVVFTLCMESGDRLSIALVEANLFFAGTLLGLGTAKIVGKAFAQRPPEPAATITAKKAEVEVAGDVNFQTPKAE